MVVLPFDPRHPGLFGGDGGQNPHLGRALAVREHDRASTKCQTPCTRMNQIHRSVRVVVVMVRRPDDWRQ